jgi:hypothetical protein
MFKCAAAIALALVLTPALVSLLPDWGGIIYESPAVISQAFQA